MTEDMDESLKKELEALLNEDSGGNEIPPCKYYRLVPPPGCIIGWDISQCNFCSFYKPADMPERRKDKDTKD